MITRVQGLLRWAHQWRTLRAWRRDLSDVKIQISDQIHNDRLGTCWTLQQRVVVYRGDSFIDELCTLVHELAHAATIVHSHDETWQATFSAAVSEITGIAVTPVAYNYEVLNLAAKDALRSWWKSSGNEFAWRLARKAS